MLLTTLTVLGAALLWVVVGFFALWLMEKRDTKEKPRDWFAPLEELSIRQEALETRWKRHLEELDDRVEAGNTAWRRIRSTEAARLRRQERDDEPEPEPVEDHQTVLGLDGAGSDPRGMSYVPEGLAGSVEPPWRSVARELARSIAEGGGN